MTWRLLTGRTGVVGAHEPVFDSHDVEVRVGIQELKSWDHDRGDHTVRIWLCVDIPVKMTCDDTAQANPEAWDQTTIKHAVGQNCSGKTRKMQTRNQTTVEQD